MRKWLDGSRHRTDSREGRTSKVGDRYGETSKKNCGSSSEGFRESRKKGCFHSRERCDPQPRIDLRNTSRNREETAEKRNTQSCYGDTKSAPKQHSKDGSNEGITRAGQLEGCEI